MDIVDYCSLENILTVRNHRPYPLPDTRWVLTQKWKDVLFLHWPVAPELISSHIPKCFQLDLYDDTAWMGVVFFQVNGMRLRSMPLLPWISSYLQLNVRTYVTYKGLPGVYFLSLDVNSMPARVLGKIVYSLPFQLAKMKMDKQGSYINIVSRREKGRPFGELSCSYAPVLNKFQPETNTIEHWLMERYCLWGLKDGEVYRTDIHHTKWTLQKAEAMIHSNSLAHFLPSKVFQRKPLIHYAANKQAMFWLPLKDKL